MWCVIDLLVLNCIDNVYIWYTVVTMFVESNCSEGESDVTVIKGLSVFGQPLNGTDVSQIKKQGW